MISIFLFAVLLFRDVDCGAVSPFEELARERSLVAQSLCNEREVARPHCDEFRVAVEKAVLSNLEMFNTALSMDAQTTLDGVRATTGELEKFRQCVNSGLDLLEAGIIVQKPGEPLNVGFASAAETVLIDWLSTITNGIMTASLQQNTPQASETRAHFDALLDADIDSMNAEELEKHTEKMQLEIDQLVAELKKLTPEQDGPIEDAARKALDDIVEPSSPKKKTTTTKKTKKTTNTKTEL